MAGVTQDSQKIGQLSQQGVQGQTKCHKRFLSHPLILSQNYFQESAEESVPLLARRH